MKKMLKKKVVCVYHYIDGERIAGCPSGLRGDVSGLSGDVDSCCISEEERQNGIDVSTLVGE